jgi:hypothetical protein
MVTVRCKECGVELTSHPTKTKCCGCSNMTTVRGETITALDLSRVVMVSNTKDAKKNSLFTTEDLAYQESRRQRKVRKLDFEIK